MRSCSQARARAAPARARAATRAPPQPARVLGSGHGQRGRPVALADQHDTAASVWPFAPHTSGSCSQGPRPPHGPPAHGATSHSHLLTLRGRASARAACSRTSTTQTRCLPLLAGPHCRAACQWPTVRTLCNVAIARSTPRRGRGASRRCTSRGCRSKHKLHSLSRRRSFPDRCPRYRRPLTRWSRSHGGWGSTGCRRAAPRGGVCGRGAGLGAGAG